MHAPILILLLSIAAADAASIGVTYGRRATSLPPPADVDRARLLNADPLALRAFAGMGLAMDVTVPSLADSVAFARHWERASVAPYAAAGTNMSWILVGSDVISPANRTLLREKKIGRCSSHSIVPAMQNLHTALVAASLHRRIKVSTAHSLGILAVSTPPTSGRFREGYAAAVIKPFLGFPRSTGAPFMVNAYPFYGLTNDTELDFALFTDAGTGLLYTNALDAELDAVHWAMERLGFGSGVLSRCSSPTPEWTLWADVVRRRAGRSSSQEGLL